MFKKKKTDITPTPQAGAAAAEAVFEPTPDMFEKLDESSKNAEKIAYESKTYFKDAWGRFKQNKMAMVGLIFLAFMILMCILVPVFSPYTYDGQDLNAINEMSSLAHPMGTDYLGRDLLVRVMMGGRISLSVGFAAAAISMCVGITYGGIAGYFGGKTDLIIAKHRNGEIGDVPLTFRASEVRFVDNEDSMISQSFIPVSSIMNEDTYDTGGGAFPSANGEFDNPEF